MPTSARAELPFAIDVPEKIGDESWIVVDVVSAEANALMSDRLELKTMLNVCCETRRRKTETIVQEVEEGEEMQKRSGFVILWPESGETAWDVGKRYAIPVESVKVRLKDGEIEEGKPLVLKM